MEEPNLPSPLDAGLKSTSTAGGEGPTMERASPPRGHLPLFVLSSLLGRTSRANKRQLSSAGPGGPSLPGGHAAHSPEMQTSLPLSPTNNSVGKISEQEPGAGG